MAVWLIRKAHSVVLQSGHCTELMYFQCRSKYNDADLAETGADLVSNGIYVYLKYEDNTPDGFRDN